MNLPSLFRGSNDIWNSDPFRRVSQLQREMDRIFGDFQNNLPDTWSRDVAIPACEVEETAGHMVVSMDVPGLKKEDIKIELVGNQLNITGERKMEKEENKKGNYRSERTYTSYARSFSLPDDVKAEDIATEYKDGVLRIAVPKGAATETKQIKVGEGKTGFFDRIFHKDKKEIEVKDQSKVA